MSHNHRVSLGDYMQCKPQVAAYSRMTFALIPSM